jgi:hypothetical protein
LTASAACPADCLSWLRSSHDRRTMILSGSVVNQRGSQPARSCLASPPPGVTSPTVKGGSSKGETSSAICDARREAWSRQSCPIVHWCFVPLV